MLGSTRTSLVVGFVVIVVVGCDVCDNFRPTIPYLCHDCTAECGIAMKCSRLCSLLAVFVRIGFV